MASKVINMKNDEFDNMKNDRDFWKGIAILFMVLYFGMILLVAVRWLIFVL